MKSLREWLAVAGLVATVIIVAAQYGTLPDRVPTHFDANGVVNGWGGKHDLWMMPVFACLMYATLTLVRFVPERTISMPVNESQRAAALPMCMEMLGWIKAESMWMSAGIAWSMVAGAQGQDSTLMMVIPLAGSAVILGTVGFYLWKMMKLPA